MMLSFKCGLLLFMHQLMVTTATESCDRTNCHVTNNGFTSVTHATFEKLENHQIAVWTPVANFTVAGTREEMESSCIGRCAQLGVNGCRSGFIYDVVNEESFCVLYKEDTYNVFYSTKQMMFKNKSGSVTFYLTNTFCKKTDCNNRPCIPDFKRDTGKCNCDYNSGQYCQIPDPLNGSGTGHWIINENYQLENIASEKLENGDLANGIVLGVPDRKERVIQCNGNGDGQNHCFSAPPPSTNATCLSDFRASQYCPNGFTYSFWLRILKDENYDSESSELAVINQAYLQDAGIAIVYRPEFYISIETSSTTLRCNLNSYQGLLFKQWNFLAFSYNPYNGKIKCAFNKNVIEVVGTSTSQNLPSTPFKFGGAGQFLVADVVYFPKPSDEEFFHILYEKTKR